MRKNLETVKLQLLKLFTKKVEIVIKSKKKIVSI